MSDLTTMIGVLLWQVSLVASGAAIGAIALLALAAAISKVFE
jgi:hypothetical protein